MKNFSVKLQRSLDFMLRRIYGLGAYPVSSSSLSRCLTVRCDDNIFTHSFCRVLASWCAENGCTFCFALSADNCIICNVFID